MLAPVRLGSARAFAVLAVALLVRVSIVALMAADDPFFENVRADSVLYLERAATIAGGTLMAGRVFDQGPLYPYLLAPLVDPASPPPILAIGLLQAAADAVTALLVAMLGARLSRSATVGLGAGLAYGLLREPSFYAGKVLPATPLLLAIVAGLLAASRPRAGARAAGGALLGTACLLWPGTLLAIPLIALWIAAGEGRRTQAAALLLGSGVAIAPATLHNLAYESRPSLISSHGGITFYQGNNERARGTYTSEGAGSDIRNQAREAVELARRIEGLDPGRELSHSDASRILGAAARRWLLEHPGRAVELAGRKLLLLWSGRELPLMYSMALEARRFVPALLWLPAGFTLLSILLPPALVLLRREDAVALAPTFAAGTGIALVQALVFVTTRYKLPLLPLGCLWIALAAARVRGSSRARLALAATLLVPGLALARADRHKVAIPLALYTHLSDIRRGEGDLAAALLEVEMARELRPDHPGSVSRAGQLREEARHVPLAAILAPTADLDGDPGALAASAVLAAARGELRLARRLARTSLATGGRSSVTRRLAGEVLARDRS